MQGLYSRRGFLKTATAGGEENMGKTWGENMGSHLKY